MAMLLRVLIVEDSKDDAELLVAELRQGGFEPTWERVETAEAMEVALNKGPWDLVLADYSMPKFDGLLAFRLLQKRDIDVPFIIVSGTIGEETAVKAMKEGVQDYLLKDKLTRLNSAIQRELREAKIRKEREQLEQQLLQSQKLESLGRLAGTVAHDFNNILVAMASYAGLIRMKYGSDNADLVKKVGKIMEAADRADKLTRQLLAFARETPLQMKAVDIHKEILSSCQMLTAVVKKQIKIETKLKAKTYRVWGDYAQIQGAFLNIGLNARDAMPKGGCFLVETRSIELSAPEKDLVSGTHVVISFSDTGVGMDEETRRKVFQPFFTTKKVQEGSGLGLAGVYGCIKAHGGHIEVESEKGSGSTFRIFLPCSQRRPKVGSGQRLELGAYPARILVVDDEDLFRGMVEEFLVFKGYTVVTVSNGAEALDYYRQNADSVDLVLLDMNMPVMGGRKCFYEMKKVNSALRAVVMTGDGSNKDLQAMKTDGLFGWLTKPIPPEDLLRTIRQALVATGEEAPKP